MCGSKHKHFTLLCSTLLNFTLVIPSTLPEALCFSNYVLDISDGFHDMGGVRWELALSLLGAWILVGLCLIKGIKSQGKVSA
jgi:hypothetical protein